MHMFGDFYGSYSIPDQHITKNFNEIPKAAPGIIGAYSQFVRPSFPLSMQILPKMSLSLSDSDSYNRNATVDDDARRERRQEEANREERN